MIVPPPWGDDDQRKLPERRSGTFSNVFWSSLSTYIGNTVRELQELLEAGAVLNASVCAGAGNVCGDVRPVVPKRLEGVRAACPVISMEELPPVDFCEDTDAVVRAQSRCLRYTQSLMQLLDVTRSCCGSWGRLHRGERNRLRKALTEEAEARFSLVELCTYFVDLRFCHKGIDALTPDIFQFSNVTKLVLSNNPGLTSIPYLPPACLVFIACGCNIRQICGSNTLALVGLSFNAMDGLDFINEMPSLRVLDLTRNTVFDLVLAIDSLRNHPTLDDVTFTGCPIALLDNYKENITRGCPRLRKLDGVTLPCVNNALSASPRKAPSVEDGASTYHSCVATPRELSFLVSTGVPIAVTVVKLEGVSNLFHTLLPRDDRSLIERPEPKARKGKRKAKPAAVGISYEFATHFSLKGSWGGEEGAILKCENIPILPAAPSGRATTASRRTLQPSPNAIDNVAELNHTARANIPTSAKLSDLLAQALAITLEVRDDVQFASGNSVTLTYEMGTFVADCSSLLLSTGPPPRALSVKVPIILSEAALAEKRVHARELRKNLTNSLQLLVSASQAPQSSSPLVAANSGSFRRRSKKSTSDRMNASDRFPTETRRLEDDLDELRLLSNIEEKRVDELSSLEMVLTLELSIGSAPKNNNSESSLINRTGRRRAGAKGAAPVA